MATIVARDGHDFGAPNLDGLAFFYISFAITYTVILFLALLVLFWERKTVAIRMRGFKNICCAALSLHVYLVLILLVSLITEDETPTEHQNADTAA